MLSLSHPHHLVSYVVELMDNRRHAFVYALTCGTPLSSKKKCGTLLTLSNVVRTLTLVYCTVIDWLALVSRASLHRFTVVPVPCEKGSSSFFG